MNTWHWFCLWLNAAAGWSLLVGALASVFRLDAARAGALGVSALFLLAFLSGLFGWFMLLPSQAFVPLTFGTTHGIMIGAAWASRRRST